MLLERIVVLLALLADWRHGTKGGDDRGVEDRVEVHSVTSERWDDLVALFQRRGPRGGIPMPGSCWCMWWRQRSGDAGLNKQAMGDIVAGGGEPGLLAYVDDSPVGWVSVDRREYFGQLLRSPQYKPRDNDTDVFAIVCFYIDPRARGAHVADALLDAAIDFARERDAASVEAYPKANADYMGRHEAFDSRGFRPVRVAGKRTVLRLDFPR